MDILELMRARHAVRSYDEGAIAPETAAALQAELDACNRAGGLHMCLCLDEPRAFEGMLPRYGHFAGAKNYLALVGPKSPDLEEKIGYYGEKVVLKGTELGLKSCWVAATYSKGSCAAAVAPGEKLVCVVSLGYSENGGTPHKSKPLAELCAAEGDMPPWFSRGMEAALLAPTALNQQKFHFSLRGDTVTAKAGFGPYTKLDLGIVKCHFELGAGKENFRWAD